MNVKSVKMIVSQFSVHELLLLLVLWESGGSLDVYWLEDILRKEFNFSIASIEYASRRLETFHMIQRSEVSMEWKLTEYSKSNFFPPSIHW